VKAIAGQVALVPIRLVAVVALGLVIAVTWCVACIVVAVDRLVRLFGDRVNRARASSQTRSKIVVAAMFVMVTCQWVLIILLLKG
jgi:uncharacterized membrane protein YecN with MAPEG domain